MDNTHKECECCCCDLQKKFTALSDELDRWKLEAEAARELLDTAKVIDERFFFHFGLNGHKGLYETWKAVRAANDAAGKEAGK